jgi:hypothetical protein
VAHLSAAGRGGARWRAGRGRTLLAIELPGSGRPASIPRVKGLRHATMSLVGVFRKQGKQGQASDWIAPGQMIFQPAGPGGQPGPGARPVPARLRAVHNDRPGEWLRGALRLAPGSLLWEPDAGISADPVELATAWAVPAAGRRGSSATVTDVQTPAGRFQLELDPVLFEMSQELVAEEAARRAGPADPGAFSPPAG